MGRAAGDGGHRQQGRFTGNEELLNDVFHRWSTWAWPGIFLKVLALHPSSGVGGGNPASPSWEGKCEGNYEMDRGYTSHVEAYGPGSGQPFILLKVVWEMPNMAVLHLGCFGLGPSQRLLIIAELTKEIWKAGGRVAAPRRDSQELGNGHSIIRAVAAASAGQESLTSSVGSRSAEEDGDEEGFRRVTASGVVSPSTSPQDYSKNLGGAFGGARPGMYVSSSCSSSNVATGPPYKEGQVHKINDGMSGIATKIAFQLIRRQHSLPPGTDRVVAPSSQGAVAGLASGVASLGGGVKGNLAPFTVDSRGVQGYPTFCNVDNPSALKTPSFDRYVLSYLRSKHWLWSMSLAETR
ncbi:unnamed protein product, partial [Choristocarpus tenellus]